MKRVKAPAGFHWMKSGRQYKLMKTPGKLVKHPGASIYASFPVQKVMYAVHVKIRKLKSADLQNAYPVKPLRPGAKCHPRKKNGQ